MLSQPRASPTRSMSSSGSFFGRDKGRRGVGCWRRTVFTSTPSPIGGSEGRSVSFGGYARGRAEGMGRSASGYKRTLFFGLHDGWKVRARRYTILPVEVKAALHHCRSAATW